MHGGGIDVWLPQMARGAGADLAAVEGCRDDRHFVAHRGQWWRQRGGTYGRVVRRGGAGGGDGAAVYLAVWFFWGARNTRLEWAGVLLGIIGIAMLNMGSTLQSSPLGAVLLLMAAASWAFGSVWSRHLPLPQGAMASAAEMLVAGVALLIVSALSGEHLKAMPPLEGWLALAYLTVFGSIIAFNAYMYLLKHVRPAAATSYAYVNPAVAVLLGIVFVGESIGLEEALAMLVIISAVLLISLPQWRKPKPEIR